MNIIDKEFVLSTEKILKEKCFGSKTLFKKDLAKELGFDILNPKKLSLGLNAITIMFDLGYFKEYKIVPGKHGGIIHIPSFYRGISQVFPNGFLDCLFQTLNEMCGSNPVSRIDIAKKINFNLPQDTIVNLISLAIQKKYITGFVGKVGKNGGIIKDRASEPKLNIDPNISNSFWNSIKNSENVDDFIPLQEVTNG